MVPRVAEALRQLQRCGHHTDRADLVFVGREGEPLDGSALRRRYIATLNAAGLRRLRFHDLRHTLGSLAINVASIVQVQAWMGHADIKTTMRYLHHKSRADDARLLSDAFTSSNSGKYHTREQWHRGGRDCSRRRAATTKHGAALRQWSSG